MLGLTEWGSGIANYGKELQLQQQLRAAGPVLRKMMKEKGLKRTGVKEYIRNLARCEEMSQQFQVVTCDKSCKRQVKTSLGHVIEIPLLFVARLPAKALTKVRVTCGSGVYDVTSRTPSPPPEAIAMMKEHSHKFDFMQVWWVPNDILITEIPKPDPILVGCIKTDNGRHYAFELYRWIDETVESAWWSKEGY